MSEAKHTHTPGPWKIDEQKSGLWSVCTVYGTTHGWVDIHAPNGSDTDDHRAESSSNARLIAAAPELLEALEDLLAQVTMFCDQYGEADFETGRARAAIAKASGSTS